MVDVSEAATIRDLQTTQRTKTTAPSATGTGHDATSKRATKSQRQNSRNNSNGARVKQAEQESTAGGKDDKPAPSVAKPNDTRRSNGRNLRYRRANQSAPRARDAPETNTVTNTENSDTAAAAATNSEAPGQRAPLAQTTFRMPVSCADVTLELVNPRETLVMLRATYDSGSQWRNSRIAIPMAQFDEFVAGLELAEGHLAEHAQGGILALLDSRDHAHNANVLDFVHGRSHYYIDFTCNAERTDISLKLTEKRRTGRGANSPNGGASNSTSAVRPFNVFFDKSEISVLTRGLSQFARTAAAALDQNNIQVHRVIGGQDYRLQWVATRANYLLKLETASDRRIMYPINFCRQVRTSLKKIADVHRECGTDTSLYLRQMQADREELNASRAERDLAPLPAVTTHPSQTEPSAPETANSGDDGSQTQQRVSVYRTLYMLQSRSNANARRYHFDLLEHRENGEVKLRLVEKPISGGNARRNSNPPRRHTIFLDIERLESLLADLQLAMEELPLPKEQSYYYHGGRIFFKMNVRADGVALKVKVQRALSQSQPGQQPDEQSPAGKTGEGETITQSGEAETNSQLTRYGETNTLEIPLHAVRNMMRYLSLHAPSTE